MKLSNRKNFVFNIIGLIIIILYLKGNGCVDEETPIEPNSETVENRVKKLLDTGKFNLSYYTDFSENAYKMSNESKKAMVVSDDVRCSRVGAFYLANGGNAIDSAIATKLCLTVIDFASTGLAGGGVSLSFMNGKLKMLDFREIKPHSIASNHTNPQNQSFGIPGMIMGLHDLWKQGGNLEWRTLFDLPIMIALKGWKIKPTFHNMIKFREKKLMEDPFLKNMLFHNGEVKPIGGHIINDPLAKTLHHLSMDHKRIYTGDIAKSMIEFLKNKSIIHSLHDFSEYKTSHPKLLMAPIDEKTNLITSSDKLGGQILLSILNLVKSFKQTNKDVFLSDTSTNTNYYPNLYDFMHQSYKTPANVGSVVKHTIKDPVGYSTEKVKQSYNSSNDESVEMEETTSDVPPDAMDTPPEHKHPRPFRNTNGMGLHEIPGTSSVSVIDGCGNGVSIETSMKDIFSGLMSYPTLGFMVNKQLSSWTVDKNNSTSGESSANNDTSITRHVNYMTPTLLFNKKHERIEAIFSATGGMRIPSVLAQVIINHYYRNLTLAESVNQFRIFVNKKPNTASSEVAKKVPKPVQDILFQKKQVHLANIKLVYSSTISGIKLDLDKNAKPTKIEGVGDFRRHGGAAGI